MSEPNLVDPDLLELAKSVSLGAVLGALMEAMMKPELADQREDFIELLMSKDPGLARKWLMLLANGLRDRGL